MSLVAGGIHLMQQHVEFKMQPPSTLESANLLLVHHVLCCLHKLNYCWLFLSFHHCLPCIALSMIPILIFLFINEASTFCTYPSFPSIVIHGIWTVAMIPVLLSYCVSSSNHKLLINLILYQKYNCYLCSVIPTNINYMLIHLILYLV